MVVVLKNVLEEVIKCAIDPKTVFGFLKPGHYSKEVYYIPKVYFNLYSTVTIRLETNFFIYFFPFFRNL